MIKSFFSRWMHKVLLLLAIATSTSAAYGQANFWTIFGQSGGTCNAYNRMRCTLPATTSSFSAVLAGRASTPYDLYEYSYGTNAYSNTSFQNSMYDPLGNLLFVANGNGIFAPDGTSVYSLNYDFSYSYPGCTTYGPPYSLAGSGALSEICIIPNYGKCNSYYAIFWGFSAGLGSYSQGAGVSVIEIDIDPVGFNAGHYSSCYTCTFNFLNIPTCGTSSSDYNTFPFNSYDNTSSGSSGAFEIAVNPNSDKSFDIYTINNEYSYAGPGGYVGTLRKWHIYSNGVLQTYGQTGTYSVSSNVVATGLLPAATTKAKIFHIPNVTSAGVTDPLFAYVASSLYAEGGLFYGYNLQTYNLNPASTTPSQTYSMTGPDATFKDIWGFEYITTGTSTPTYIFNYRDEDPFLSGQVGGFAYAPVIGSGTSHDITLLSNSGGALNYLGSDLELDQAGDLMAVYSPTVTTTNNLAYIPSGSLSSIITTSVLPTPLTCDGTHYIPVSNYQYQGFWQSSAMYLGSQVRNLNYNSLNGYDLSTYTVPGSTTWTPASNPVTNVTGVATSTITADNIIIPAGVSLTISGMTIQNAAGSYIDVYNSSSSSASIGGRLILNNSTLTIHTGGCDGASGMWGGVRVWGDPAQAQIPVSASHQGMVTMAGSAISYAQTGVYAGDPSFRLTLAGGGIVQATNSTFDNNYAGVAFLPYAGSAGNASSFSACTFKSEDPATTEGGNMFGIWGTDVNGITIRGCNFINNLGTGYNTYGIYGKDMGFTVDDYLTFGGGGPVYTPCTFSNYSYGIQHNTVAYTSYAAVVRNATFTYNKTGLDLVASVAPVVVGNTFNVGPSEAFDGVVVSPIQSIGLELNTAYNYSVYNNTFKFYSSSISRPFSNLTVGVLAWNTEKTNEDEMIKNNSYNGLGTANLAEYINNALAPGFGARTGLWYSCNQHTNDVIDIAATGNNYSVDGIRPYQGYPTLSAYAGYPLGISAGNTFTTSSSAYNLYNLPTQCLPFTYYYAPMSIGGSDLEQPGLPGTTAKDDPSIIEVTAAITDNNCILPLLPINGGGDGGSVNIGAGNIMHTGSAVVNPSQSYSPIDNALAVLNNISYYMADSSGIPHRDSLYYWVGRLPQGPADMITAHLLLEDGYADSAYALFHSIPDRDSLDSIASAEISGTGGALFDVQTRITAHYANIKAALAAAYAGGEDADSLMATDSALFYSAALDTGSLDTLVQIFDNSHFWSRTGAENVLCTYFPDTLKAMLTAMPDTLLYPNPDSAVYEPSPSGALAVTEISQGPIADSGACAYAELVVTNCGLASSPFVNVAGWIIDDNSGIFDTAGCTAGNMGITRGHYRFAPDNTLWQNIRIGTVIAVYDADVNCYNLPDTFTIDTVNYIIYIPVYTATAATGYVLERFSGAENTDAGSYCSDTGTTVYTPASDWLHTMALEPADAVEVRCPGCTTAYPGTPAFYQGIGYAPDSTYCFNGVPAGSNSPGGALEIAGGGYQKYVFNGSAIADFTNPAMWTAYAADTAGIAPQTLGHVDSALRATIANQTLGLPCCGNSPNGGRKANATTGQPQPLIPNKAVKGIKVYPNPADGNIYFEFPAGDATITLMDLTGRTMNEQVLHNAANAMFNLGNYIPGMYMYQITTSGVTQTGKFVISR
jgi:hypothetical protein